MHVYRPGIRALKELGIISPLAELHITKAQVKALASEYGISVASRPSTPLHGYPPALRRCSGL